MVPTVADDYYQCFGSYLCEEEGSAMFKALESSILLAASKHHSQTSAFGAQQFLGSIALNHGRVLGIETLSCGFSCDRYSIRPRGPLTASRAVSSIDHITTHFIHLI